MSSPFAKKFVAVGVPLIGASAAYVAINVAAGKTPTTHNAKWKAASLEYMRFQNMNPIGLGGRKAYDPTYLRKD